MERAEPGVDHGPLHEAPVRRPDGTELVVLVDKGVSVTAVKTMQQSVGKRAEQLGAPPAPAGPRARSPRTDAGGPGHDRPN